MRFEVVKGMFKYNGVFHSKGSIFAAEKKEVERFLSTGILKIVDSKQTNEEQRLSDMTIEELKKFIENAEFDEVKQLLEMECSKSKPRNTAVKLLEEWLQNAESEDDLTLPEFDSSDVIVDGDTE